MTLKVQIIPISASDTLRQHELVDVPSEVLAQLSPAPIDPGAQNDLSSAPEPMSIKAFLAAPNGGYLESIWKKPRSRASSTA